MAKFYFSRFTLAHSIPKDKYEVLYEGISEKGTISKKNYNFSFFEIEEFEEGDKRYLTGFLVKINPLDTEQVVDEESGQIRDESLVNRVVGKSRFIIDVNSSLIMFAEVPNVIGDKIFRKRFIELFEENHSHFFVDLNINLIKERYTFITLLKQFKSINRIEIILFPSNPNFSERWEAIDTRLRANKIRKYREIQENDKVEESIIVDTETEDKFLMSEDGYGKSKASGIDADGLQKTITTNNNEKIVTDTIATSSMDKAIDLLGKLNDTLQQIISRTE